MHLKRVDRLNALHLTNLTNSKFFEECRWKCYKKLSHNTAELQYTSWWDGSGMKFEMGGMDPTWKKTIIFKQDVISEIFLVFLKTYFGHQKKSRIWPRNSEDVWEFFPSQYHYYCIPCPGSISSKTFVCYRCSWQDGWGWGWRRYFFI